MRLASLHCHDIGRLLLIITACVFLLSVSNALAADNYGSVIDTLNGIWNNYGSVATSNNNQHGMAVDHGDTSTNTASGSIVTYGDGAHGMRNVDAQSHNVGGIVTYGDNSAGMWSRNGELQNDGAITTHGTNSHGMLVTNDTGFAYTVRHSGTINVYGGGAAGLSAFNNGGGTLDLYISGSVFAHGGGVAIDADGVNVHLQSGTRIQGALLGWNHGEALYLEGSGVIEHSISGWDAINKEQAGTWILKESVFAAAINNNSGTLAVAAGKQLTATNYSQVAGSTLAVSLDSGGTIPVVAIANANVAGALAVDAPYSALTGNRVVVDAAGGAGNFDSVTSTNPHMTLSTNRVGNQIILSSGSFVPQWDNTSLGLSSTLTSNLVFLQLPGQRSRLIMASNEEQEPLMVASAGPILNLIPKPSDSEDRRYGVYLQPMYATSTRDAFGGAPGYTAHTVGIEVGADAYITDNLLLGGFAGYASADIDIGGVAFAENDSEKQKLFTVGAYGGYRNGDWIFTDTLSFTHTQNDSRRYAGVGETAKGDYTTQLVYNRFLTAYVFPVGDDWELSPELGLNANYMHRGAFAETNAANALHYDSFNDFFAEGVIGLRFRNTAEMSGTKFTSYARPAWMHDLLGNDLTVRQTLGASSAQVTQRNDNDHFDLELGILARKGDTMFSLSYNGEISTHSHSHGLMVNMRHEF